MLLTLCGELGFGCVGGESGEGWESVNTCRRCTGCVCDGVRGLEPSVCAREKRLVRLVGGKVCVCVCEQ